MGAIFGQTHKLIALQHILSLLSHHAFCLCSLYLLNCYLFHEFGLVLATHHFCCRSLTVIFFFLLIWLLFTLHYFSFSSLSLSVTRFILLSFTVSSLSLLFLFLPAVNCLIMIWLFIRQIAQNLFENNSYLMNIVRFSHTRSS